MRPYLAVIGARYVMLLQYRAAALAGFTTQFFFGAVRLMVLSAFFAAATGPQPMSFEQVVVYVWLGQALLALLPWNIDPEIQDKFVTGGVAHELLRPLDLYAFWFARTFAFRTAPTTLRVLPMLLTVFLVLPLIGLPEWALPAPASGASAFWFVASLAAAILLATAVTMVMQISLFWFLEGRGITTVMGGLVPVFSGLIVPLPLFPDWAQGFLYWQPFRGLADVPFRLYSGSITPGDAPLEVALQLGWTAVVVLLGYALLNHARGRLVVQGG